MDDAPQANCWRLIPAADPFPPERQTTVSGIFVAQQGGVMDNRNGPLFQEGCAPWD
jgi:hypothetical protein